MGISTLPVYPGKQILRTAFANYKAVYKSIQDVTGPQRAARALLKLSSNDQLALEAAGSGPFNTKLAQGANALLNRIGFMLGPISSRKFNPTKINNKAPGLISLVNQSNNPFSAFYGLTPNQRWIINAYASEGNQDATNLLNNIFGTHA